MIGSQIPIPIKEIIMDYCPNNAGDLLYDANKSLTKIKL